MAAKKRKSKKKPAPAKRTKRTRSRPDWAPAFLAELALRGNILDSCGASGVSRSNVYQRRDADPDFALAMAQALEDATDRLEREAWRRAHEGLVRKQFYKGDPLIDPETGAQYVEREYSDTLMVQLLKAHKPDKYRERREVEHTGGVALEVVERVVRTREEARQAVSDLGEAG